MNDLTPDFFAVTETHLDKDPIRPLIPSGYRQVARLDRTHHGGGVLICAKKHLPVDVLDLKKFSTPKVAEMVGISYEDVRYILCYTSNASTSLG